MNRKSNALPIFAAAIFAVLVSGQDAWAYLDPGTGSYALQVVLAAIVGSGVLFKQRLAGVFHWLKKRVVGQEPRDGSPK